MEINVCLNGKSMSDAVYDIEGYEKWRLRYEVSAKQFQMDV